jgi:hypothetical protein
MLGVRRNQHPATKMFRPKMTSFNFQSNELANELYASRLRETRGFARRNGPSITIWRNHHPGTPARIFGILPSTTAPGSNSRLMPRSISRREGFWSLIVAPP